MLRAWTLADASPLATAIHEAEIHRWLDMLPDPYTIQDSREFLAEAGRIWTEGTGAALAITRAGILVGGIGLNLGQRVPGVSEVGYWVAASARGRGVATEGLGSIAQWAFTTLGLHRIELHAAFENYASRGVAEAAGFIQEGVKRSWRAVHGQPHDFVLCARVQPDRLL